MREFSLNNLVTHYSACNNGKLSYILRVCGSVGGALRSTTCRERTPRAAVRRISRRLSRWTKFLAGIYSFLLYIYIFIYVYNYAVFLTSTYSGVQCYIRAKWYKWLIQSYRWSVKTAS